MYASQVCLAGETSLYDCWPSDALIETFDRAVTTGQVTADDRAVLLSSLFKPHLQEEELRLIDRLYWLVRQGQVKIIHESSLDDKYKDLKPRLDRESRLQRLIALLSL